MLGLLSDCILSGPEAVRAFTTLPLGIPHSQSLLVSKEDEKYLFYACPSCLKMQYNPFMSGGQRDRADKTWERAWRGYMHACVWVCACSLCVSFCIFVSQCLFPYEKRQDLEEEGGYRGVPGLLASGETNTVTLDCE